MDDSDFDDVATTEDDSESPIEISPGTLYIVATPIGNLADLSPRARTTLSQVDLILCEDTRHFARLAGRFGIKTPRRSLHDHNEKYAADTIVRELVAGSSMALVSDAGTPLISDPGFRLVSAAREAGVNITSVPGPCAAITALSICGFEVERFFFEGFLPQKSGRRRTVLQNLLAMDVVTVCYESPHRILKSLQEIAQLAPNRMVCVARELTKLHEEILTGTVAEVCETLSKKPKILGEFVLIIRRPAEDESA